MVAIDTNILVYAHREDTEWHDRALARPLELAQSTDRWAIPWPCVHEFISVTTRERYFDPPSTIRSNLSVMGHLLIMVVNNTHRMMECHSVSVHRSVRR